MEKWNILLVLHLGALFNAAFCLPPIPVDVLFTSINLQNKLHWKPGNQTPPESFFKVQYAIYGDRVSKAQRQGLHWRVVPRCSALEDTWCDLTNQTWDLDQGYYARVRAVDGSGSSHWKVTRDRFDPNFDTVLGPPLVTLEGEGNSVTVTIKSPMRYLPDNHKPEVSMLEVYPQMMFNLSVRIGESKNLTSHIAISSSPYVQRMLKYSTVYCFSAKVKLISRQNQCQPSDWQCFKTPPDPVLSELRNMIVGIVVPLLCICVLTVGCYFLHYLVWGKKEKCPRVLEATPHSCPPATFTPEDMKADAIRPVVRTPLLLDMDPWGTQPPVGVPPPLLPYAPQALEASPEPESPEPESPEPEFPESETPESGSPLGSVRDFFVVDYGFVVAAEVNDGQGLGNGGAEEQEQEEQEEDASMIQWDPEGIMLVLPGMPLCREAGLQPWRMGAGQPRGRGGQEEQGVGPELGGGGGGGGGRGPTLENVFVRQGSEEEREAAREREWGAGTLLANWDLVVQMDE